MSSTEQAAQVYQLRIWIWQISPQIWHRFFSNNYGPRTGGAIPVSLPIGGTVTSMALYGEGFAH